MSGAAEPLIGRIVVVEGLRTPSALEHNGKQGMVISGPDPATGRFEVRLNGQTKQKERLGLTRQNFRLWVEPGGAREPKQYYSPKAAERDAQKIVCYPTMRFLGDTAEWGGSWRGLRKGMRTIAHKQGLQSDELLRDLRVPFEYGDVVQLHGLAGTGTTLFVGVGRDGASRELTAGLDGHPALVALQIPDIAAAGLAVGETVILLHPPSL